MPRYHEKKNFLQFTDKDANFNYEELKKEKRLLNMRSGITTSVLRDNITYSTSVIQPVFIDGVKTAYFVSPSGQIVSSTKTVQHRGIDKNGCFYYKTRSRFYEGFKNKKVHHIVAENFLIPKGDNIRAYSVSFKDGDKRNCQAENLVLRKRGSMGVAIKKQVSVFKHGTLFAVFDSVTRCAKALDIPRRRISEFLKDTEKTVKGLTFKYN